MKTLNLSLLVLSLPVAIGLADDPNPEDIRFFEARVRPILVEHCYDCHGPESAEGKLRLDSRSGWARGGEAGPTIVPGDPSASLLLKAVGYKDSDLQMPPADAGGRLSDRQIQDLTTWIRRGAADPRGGQQVVREIDRAAESHWAFQPVPVPELGDTDQNPIDLLIGIQQSAAGFQAVAQADVQTLVRRVVFDLHGLPPTAEQLKTTKSQFPDLVRDLLDSPRYGERWGRHWLDVARYADAKDGVLMYGDARIRPFAYTYRDYVIRSFNEDKPFDQFIREQIAADQLSLSADSPALAGMGLLTLGRMFDNNRHDVIDDQIDVVSRGFLGLTVSCARCHDHKFDPVPTADYYSLYGVFASSIEPYERPRIEEVSEVGQAFETEYRNKLNEVYALQQSHYQDVLQKARTKTPDYLVQVATTEPDVAETAIFFLSLLPEQLRPQITSRWRQLIARRAFPDDPVFGAWHDLMKDTTLKPKEWEARGIHPRIIKALVEAVPRTPAEIATVYGEVIRNAWRREQQLQEALEQNLNSRKALDHAQIRLADVVAGGIGAEDGKPGDGIHPGTGKASTGTAGFLEIPATDQVFAVEHPFVDCVFVPKSGTTSVTTTGLTISDLRPSSGGTWDYIRFGPSSGSTNNAINGVDYNAAPHSLVAMHANKGITFDLQAMRKTHFFVSSRFRCIFGHGGAKGMSKVDFAVYLDGHRLVHHPDFEAQQEGLQVDIAIPGDTRFLTLVVTEAADGIGHDQGILGDPVIVPDRTERPGKAKQERLAELDRERLNLEQQLKQFHLADDPIARLLVSSDGPIWFPKSEIYYYLDRQKKDAYRGTVNQLDSIAVKHKQAASRAMTLVDSDQLYDPVIFQRGDPSARGTAVPRRFLSVLSSQKAVPFPDGSGRLNLANAIASKQNPLTARVWANRVWMHHFGEPLVPDPSDFGLRTQAPVQQQLLDYLAWYLMASDWHTRPLHELILSSRAWQRSSLVPDEPQFQDQLKKDPQNSLLWRAHRRRLGFEQLRDTVLAVSGQLDLTMYGRPALITDANNRRRTVYAFVERQNIPSVVRTFDFANADTSTGRRVNTTVPQQALFAMNSEFMRTAADALAKQVMEMEPAEQIERLYLLAFGRSPDDEERRLALDYLKSGTVVRFAQVLLMSNQMTFVD